MYFIVYKTTNVINKKYYIGIHKCKSLEFDGYYGSGILLNHSINKHGKENFIRETLFICHSWDDARDKEREIVTEQFCLMESTYNISVGGTGGNTLAGASPERRAEVRSKMIASNIKNGSRIYEGDKLIQAQNRMRKIRIQPDNKGRIHTKEARSHMGSRNGGMKWINNGIDSAFHNPLDDLPPGWKYGRAANYKKFQNHSAETKIKIADAISGNVCYNNGVKNLKLKVGMSPPDGFVKGMIQIRPPFNWINDGARSEQLILKTDAIPEGWKLGRIFRKRKKNVRNSE